MDRPDAPIPCALRLCGHVYVFGPGEEWCDHVLVRSGNAGEFNDIYGGLGLTIVD